MGGCGGLERTDFNSFYFGRVWWYLKELILNSFYYWKGVVIMKELISTDSTLGGCGDLERTAFYIVSNYGMVW